MYHDVNELVQVSALFLSYEHVYDFKIISWYTKFRKLQTINKFFICH